jgi:hypothetical protein
VSLTEVWLASQLLCARARRPGQGPLLHQALGERAGSFEVLRVGMAFLEPADQLERPEGVEPGAGELALDREPSPEPKPARSYPASAAGPASSGCASFAPSTPAMAIATFSVFM